MAKIFRNIRQKLLVENRVSRYLLYAVGEIILVVIGILIALQVNEWNNERNRENWEKETLGQLQKDLEESQTELEDIKKLYLERAQASAKVLRAFWKNDIPYERDSLREYLWTPMSSRVYSPPLGTARALINSGKIDLIKKSRIKTAIISYVEKVDYMLKDIARYEETYYRPAIAIFNNELPNTVLTLNDFKKLRELQKQVKDTSDAMKQIFALDLQDTPSEIDRVPFQTDPQSIFHNRQMFIAYNKLLVAHRNRYFRYKNIQESTDELLGLLNKNEHRSK